MNVSSKKEDNMKANKVLIYGFLSSVILFLGFLLTIIIGCSLCRMGLRDSVSDGSFCTLSFCTFFTPAAAIGILFLISKKRANYRYGKTTKE